MKIEELQETLNKEIIEILKKEGIERLNPAQKKAVENNLFNESMIVSAPTAAGKTLIAELAFLNEILNNKRKVIYIVPLRALASEKYKEFKKKYEKIGITISLSMGSYDSKDPWLSSYDLIIVTSEKLDSLIRHKAPWLLDTGLIIIDEIHLLNDMSRGPTLEITITRIRDIINPKILGLSATINNSEELAEWLDAKHVHSDYRPIPLKKGVVYNNTFYFKDEEIDLAPFVQDPALNTIHNITKEGKQALVFVNSRRNAESLSEKLKNHIHLNEKERKKLEKVSEKIKNVLETPTSQCLRASKAIKHGACFHHAGLVNEQREIIEESFKKGLIKVIVSTPTLAMGVNLPASYVIIRDLYRYEGGYGMRPIPVLEYEQMTGRSGRPRYDKEGISLTIAKSESEMEKIFDKYINAESEKIHSKLSLEPILRMHLLSLIATNHVSDTNELYKFMEKTFYAYQFRNIGELIQKINRILKEIENYGFIEIKTEGDIKSNDLFQKADSYIEKQILTPTTIGKRVAELYIDPLTAHILLSSLKKPIQLQNKEVVNMVLIQLLSSTLELRPPLRIKKPEEDIYFEKLVELKDYILIDMDYFYSQYDVLATIKTMHMFYDWINEKTEKYLSEAYDITPGELRVKLDIIDWLLYSTHELIKTNSLSDLNNDLDTLKRNHKLLKSIDLLRTRIKYGVKEELIPLVQIKGIGRKKARKLYQTNIKKLSDMKKVSRKYLEDIVGKKTAEKLKSLSG